MCYYVCLCVLNVMGPQGKGRCVHECIHAYMYTQRVAGIISTLLASYGFGGNVCVCVSVYIHIYIDTHIQICTHIIAHFAI
jgi:hypothetical protein